LLYELRIGSPKLNTSSYPPDLALNVTITNATNKLLPILLHFAIYLESAENVFTYWIATTPNVGKSTKVTTLAFEPLAFLKASIQLKNADRVNMNIDAKIIAENGAEIAHDAISYAVDRDLWVDAIREGDKAPPTGVKAHQHFAVILESKISELENKTSNDPMTQLQRRILDHQILEVKNYLLNQPEMKKLQDLLPLEQVCSSMKIDPKWAVAAALLSSLEGYMKDWLVKNAAETFTNLKRKEFDELLSKMGAALSNKKIAYQQKRLSDIAGLRHLRNKVLHEMYVPIEDEIKEIRDESIEFVRYIESIMPK